MTLAPKRRWFAYSLGTLFVVVTVFACWLGYSLNWIRQRHEFIASELQFAQIRGAAVTIAHTYPSEAPHHAPTLLWALGEQGFSGVYVLVDADSSRQRLSENDLRRELRAKRLFPEATVYETYEGWNSGAPAFTAYPAPD